MTAPLENVDEELHIEVPLYRAEKIDSEETVEGYYNPLEHTIVREGKTNLTESFKIKTETLAIHFSNMIDTNKTKVFASLNAKGIGGDTLVSTVVLGIVANKEAATERSRKFPLISTSDGVYSGMISHLQKVTNYNEYIVSGIYKG